MNSYHGFSFQSSGGNFNPFTFENGLILANLSLRGQMSHLLKSLKIISQILDFLVNKCASKKTKTTIHKESKNGSYLVEAMSAYLIMIMPQSYLPRNRITNKRVKSKTHRTNVQKSPNNQVFHFSNT